MLLRSWFAMSRLSHRRLRQNNPTPRGHRSVRSAESDTVARSCCTPWCPPCARGLTWHLRDEPVWGGHQEWGVCVRRSTGNLIRGKLGRGDHQRVRRA